MLLGGAVIVVMVVDGLRKPMGIGLGLAKVFSRVASGLCYS